MSFNHYARKAADPNRTIQARWRSTLEALGQCIPRPDGTYPATRARWEKQWNITKENPPTEAHLFQALSEMTIARNRRIQRQHAFDAKRIRQKMRGKRNLTRTERAEWEEINGIGRSDVIQLLFS